MERELGGESRPLWGKLIVILLVLLVLIIFFTIFDTIIKFIFKRHVQIMGFVLLVTAIIGIILMASFTR